MSTFYPLLLCSFSSSLFSLVSSPCLLLAVLILTPQSLPPRCLLSFLLHSFIPLFVSLEHDIPSASFTVMALVGLRKMKVDHVGEGSVKKGLKSRGEKNDRICSHFYSCLWQCRLRVKIKSGSWASFWWVPILHELSCVLLSLGHRTTSFQIDRGSDMRMFWESI